MDREKTNKRAGSDQCWILSSRNNRIYHTVDRSCTEISAISGEGPYPRKNIGTEKKRTTDWSRVDNVNACVVSLVFNIQNSISISSSSARTFVSTGWRIKINIFVLTHSKTLTLGLRYALFRSSSPLIGPL